ncbi:MAG: ATP-binding cassette domain-containing protein [Oscillospiraceae bacterium]|nr:ATP-binding cassette domain-containing protein [Oscillospiraceae bacterium]
MILSAESVYKYYNGEAILRDVNFTIEDKERIGLIGVNGCGKSTLLRIIIGEELCDKTSDGKGSISISNNRTFGILKQNSGLDSEETIINEMRKPFKKLLEVKERMTQLEAMMTELSGAELEDAGAEYSSLSSFFEAQDGYRIDVRISTVLNGMGFPQNMLDRKVSSLSGGEKTRLALSKLLIESPDLLILDEPTNHLDVKTLRWLEDYLKSYKGAILVVSHDRYFLDKTVEKIFEIENTRLTSYKGNYTVFVNLKKMSVARQAKEYELQQKEIAKLEDYIARNKVRASSANMAKSRQHMLDRIERVEKPQEDVKPPKIKLEYDIVPPKDLLNVEGCELAVGEGATRKIIADDISFRIRRGEKVAFVGPNGAGKTSILKLIQGIIGHEKGRVSWTANVKLAYFEQEHAYLRPQLSSFEEVQDRYPTMSELMIRKHLASVLITGEDVFKPISVLSGGERAKLCFCLMALKRGNVLILDEPTNHLDLNTMEVLEEALVEYDGTIILVSHDRYLLSKVADRIVEIDEGKLESFAGGYTFYSDEKEKRRELAEREKLARKEEERKRDSEQRSYRSKEQRAQAAKKRQLIAQLEKEIEQLEGQISRLEELITTEEYANDYEKMSAGCLELENMKNQLDEKLTLWASEAE